MTRPSIIKIFGFLLIIVGSLVAAGFIWTQLSDFRGGFYDLVGEGLIPASIIILLTVPVGRSYLRFARENTILSLPVKIALWLQYIAFLLYLSALIPLAGNLMGRFDGEGAGIMSLIILMFASVPYIVGIILLIINKFKQHYENSKM